MTRPAPISLGECGKHPTLSVSLLPSHLVRVLWFPSSSLTHRPHLHHDIAPSHIPRPLTPSFHRSYVSSSPPLRPSSPGLLPASFHRPLIVLFPLPLSPPPSPPLSASLSLPYLSSVRHLPSAPPSSCCPFPRLRRPRLVPLLPSPPPSSSWSPFRVIVVFPRLPSSSSSPPPLVILSPRRPLPSSSLPPPSRLLISSARLLVSCLRSSAPLLVFSSPPSACQLPSSSSRALPFSESSVHPFPPLFHLSYHCSCLPISSVTSGFIDSSMYTPYCHLFFVQE